MSDKLAGVVYNVREVACLCSALDWSGPTRLVPTGRRLHREMKGSQGVQQCASEGKLNSILVGTNNSNSHQLKKK